MIFQGSWFQGRGWGSCQDPSWFCQVPHHAEPRGFRAGCPLPDAWRASFRKRAARAWQRRPPLPLGGSWGRACYAGQVVRGGSACVSLGRRELGKIDRMPRPGSPWVRAPLLWFARDPHFLRWPLPTSAGPAASSAGYLGSSLCPYPRPACHLLHRLQHCTARSAAVRFLLWARGKLGVAAGAEARQRRGLGSSLRHIRLSGKHFFAAAAHPHRARLPLLIIGYHTGPATPLPART